MSSSASRPNFGPYRLRRLIGRGGMGEVYHATLIREGGFSKVMVIKRILPQFTQQKDFIKRFLDEARLSATLNHRNIIHIYDFGKEEGNYFLAMEYIEGASLDCLISACKSKNEFMPHSFWAHIALEILDGLAYAHQHRDDDGNITAVIHRDITPGNIFISRTGEVKIGDFGLALVGKSSSGGIAGTPMYMAPEQAAGLPADERSDLFGLAITLYEGICLKQPRNFEGMSEGDKLDYIRNTTIMPPSERGVSVDADVEAFLMQALNLKPRDRFPTAHVMQKELKEIIDRHGWKDSENELSLFIEKLIPEISAPIIDNIEATRIADTPLSPSLSDEGDAQYTFLKSKKLLSKTLSIGTPLALIAFFIWFMVFHYESSDESEKEPTGEPLPVIVEPQPETEKLPGKNIVIEKKEPEKKQPKKIARSSNEKSTPKSPLPNKEAKAIPAFKNDYMIELRNNKGKLAAVNNSKWKGGNRIHLGAGIKILKLTDAQQKNNLVVRFQMEKLSANPNGFKITMATIPWLSLSLNGVALTDESSRTRRKLVFGRHKIVVYSADGKAIIKTTINVQKRPALN